MESKNINQSSPLKEKSNKINQVLHFLSED